MNHPLDRPVWSALTGRQAALARGDARAWRLPSGYGLFAAAADPQAPGEALAALIGEEGALGLVETGPVPVAPGTAVIRSAWVHQMVAETPILGDSSLPIVPLDDSDAPAMLALATATEPGPFFDRTHQLGDFVGIKQDGALVAMAGERMRVDRFTEVSAVCTDPAWRGRGYAAALMRRVMAGIVARGETPFLHSYSDNVGAIALYETLGFRLRRQVLLTVIGRA
jgi:predicted GNAT family acetyltransferase